MRQCILGSGSPAVYSCTHVRRFPVPQMCNRIVPLDGTPSQAWGDPCARNKALKPPKFSTGKAHFAQSFGFVCSGSKLPIFFFSIPCAFVRLPNLLTGAKFLGALLNRNGNRWFWKVLCERALRFAWHKLDRIRRRPLVGRMMDDTVSVTQRSAFVQLDGFRTVVMPD